VDAGVDAGGLFEPVTVSAYLAEVKDLLTGLPPTDAEYATVNGNPSALSGLITTWISGGATQTGYQGKMLSFFANAFQQSDVTAAEFQLGQNIEAINGPMLQDLQQSFAQTAWELVQEGQPFTAVATTNRFMLTPALMALYARIDSQNHEDSLCGPDAGGTTCGGKSLENYIVATDGGFTFTVEASKGALSIQQSLDPDGGQYMVFYAPELATQAADGCEVDPRVWNQVSGKPFPGLVGALYDLLFGSVSQFSLPDGGLCPSFSIAGANTLIQTSDYTSWNMVTIRPPKTGEQTTLFYDLPTLRALATPGNTADLVMFIPRVGFFTTPTFLAEWNTNTSNLARVTTNQTLITGLGHAFDGTDSAVPPADGGLAALDPIHAPPTSACFACHETLDPMREFFRQAYSLDFSPQTVPYFQELPGVFAFDGVSQFGTGIQDLGTLISTHPAFGPAWVEKLCEYATSASCDETDPEFIRIVGVWEASNYNWNTLVATLFSSPLVTYSAPTQTAAEQGDTVSIARQAHLCALLSNRLGVADICGLLATTAVSGKPLKTVQTIAAGYAADQYGRGIVAPLLTSGPNLFMRAGLENMCMQIAEVVVTKGDGGVYPTDDPQADIQSMTSNLMGLTSDRSAGPLSVLQQHYAVTSADAGVTNGLQSTFVLACESPYVAGLGL
jgi:hypothetical protein